MSAALISTIEKSAGDARVKGRLMSLQALRGISAAAVALYHTRLILAQDNYGRIEAFVDFSAKGWLGVNFFFVLSGFIILYAHKEDIGKPTRFAKYLFKRFMRVYPIYWVALTMYIVAAWLKIGHPDFEWGAANLLSAYTLIKFTPSLTLPLQVAWTLFYEVNFYMIFVVLIVNRQIGYVVFGVWLLLILLSNAGVCCGNDGFGLLHAWNSYFLIGMLCFVITEKIDNLSGVPVLIGGLATLAIAAEFFASGRIGETQKSAIALFVLAAPFALILIGSVICEREGVLASPRSLVLLGEASYSVYLIHSPVISILAQIHAKYFAGYAIDARVLFLSIFLASIAAGVIFHLLVERRVLKLARDTAIQFANGSSSRYRWHTH